MNVYQMDETRRARQRESARKQLAKIEIANVRCRELRQQVEAISADSDKAADLHRERTTPIQNELDEIAAEQVTQIANGRAVDSKTETRRKKLQGELHTANADLEEIVTRNKALTKPLEQELRRLEKENANVGALRNKICQYASDADLDQGWLREQDVRWADTRVKNAQRKLFDAEDLLRVSQGRYDGARDRESAQAEKANLSVYQRRVRRWRLELDQAKEQLTSAMAASDAHHQQLLEQ